MPTEIVFSRRNAAKISAAELRQQLSDKLAAVTRGHDGNRCFRLGDLGIAIFFTFGDDDKPISARAVVSHNTRTTYVVGLFRVFQSLGWDY